MESLSASRVPPDTASVAIDGARVRKLRKLSGATVTGMAKACGISQQYLSAIEVQGRTVRPPVFARICDALGVKDRRELLKADA